MKVGLKEIAQCLSQKSAVIYESYKNNIVFDDVKFITNKQEVFMSNIIYIGNTSMHKEQIKNADKASFILINDESLSVKDNFTGNINIIELATQEDIFDVFNIINELFVEEVSISKSTSTLLKSIITGKGLNHIVKVATEIFDNPLVVIDTSYKVLAYPDIGKITDEFWIENIKRGYCSYDFIAAIKKMKSVENGLKENEPFKVYCEESSTEKLVAKINIDNKQVGSVVLLACNRGFLHKDSELLTLTSKIIAEEMKKNNLYKNINNLEYDEVIIDFLEGNIHRRDVFDDRIKSTRLKLQKNIKVLVFDLENYSSHGKYFGYLTDSLNLYFPTKHSLYYNEDIVIIYDYEKNNLNVELFDKLQGFLLDNEIVLGISKEFSDMFKCKTYYEQAFKAIRLGKSMGLKSEIINYDQIQFYDMIEKTENIFDYASFYNTEIVKLLDYDKENNTELFKTLMVYLKNNQSLKLSSAELFIHRNTMTYRMQKIFELVQLNLKDPENSFNIYMSLKIMNYMKNKNNEEIIQ